MVRDTVNHHHQVIIQVYHQVFKYDPNFLKCIYLMMMIVATKRLLINWKLTAKLNNALSIKVSFKVEIGIKLSSVLMEIAVIVQIKMPNNFEPY